MMVPRDRLGFAGRNATERIRFSWWSSGSRQRASRSQKKTAFRAPSDAGR
jgi:hypothetical protein